MLIAVLSGFVLALSWWVIWRFTTDDQKADRAIQAAGGNFLEIGVYKNYPRPMLKSLGALNRSSLRLGWLLLPPSLLFLIPLFLVGFYSWSTLAFRPPAVGESVLISAPSIEALELQTPPLLTVEAGPVRVPDSQTTYWRVLAEDKGAFPLQVNGPQVTLHGKLKVMDTWTPLKGSMSGKIQVDYPDRDLWVGTRRIHFALAVFLAFLIGLPLTNKLVPRRRKKRGE